MNKVIFKNNRYEVQRGVQLKDGRVVPVVSLENKYVFRYDIPFDLKTGEVYDTPNENSTTLNEQIQKYGAKDVCCYDEYDVCLGDKPKITDSLIRKVIKEFEEHGYNVTETAIYHNISAWKGDLKSGYRDEANGYHLFSPCGCNPLSLRATTLHPSCADWQTTYFC